MEIKGKKKIYYNEKKFCAKKLNFGLLPKCIARLGSCAGCWACWRWARRHGAGGMGARARGAGAAGAGSGRHGRAERHGMEREARRQLGRRAHGMAQQARGQGMDAQGRAVGVGRGARGGRLGGLCAPGVRSWARLGVLLHLTQFLAWFDSVFFPSHQMNTVHCEIIFFEKKYIF